MPSNKSLYTYYGYKRFVLFANYLVLFEFVSIKSSFSFKSLQSQIAFVVHLCIDVFAEGQVCVVGLIFLLVIIKVFWCVNCSTATEALQLKF